MKDVIPYFALLLFSALLTVTIAFYSWKKRSVAGAWPLVILAMCGFFWTFGYAFVILGVSFEWMLFWDGVKSIGMFVVATAVLYFTLEYAGYYQWTRRPIIFILFAIPFIFYILHLTNEWHSWMYAGVPVVAHHIVTSLVFDISWLGWVSIQYNFFLVILSGIVLAHKYFYSAKIYRKQILVILLGFFIPLLGAAISLSRFWGMNGVDFASFLFVISGLLISWGVFRYQLLDLVPITHTAVLASIQDGVIVVDSSYRIVDINQSAEMLLEASLPNLLGQPVKKLFPDWQAIAPDCNTNNMLTMQLNHKDGSEWFLEVRTKPLQTVQEIAQGHLLIVHDITDRKLAEKLLAERTTLLEEEVAARIAEIHLAHEKSEIVLHNIHDAIGMIDLEGRINYVNPAFAELTGYQEEELLNMYSKQLLTGLLPEPTWVAIKQVILQRKHWQGEISLRRKNGRSYIADFLIAPVHDNDGRLVGYTSSHRDVSQQKSLDKARSQFINNISHELRTPVTNLKIYMQLMQTTLVPEKRVHYEQVMDQQVGRLEKLIQDVLEMSSLDVGESQSTWYPVYIVELIDDVIAHHQSDITRKQLAVCNLPLQPAAELVTTGDYDQLKLAICKLLDNAIRFTSVGGRIQVKTAVNTVADQAWITITFHDDGMGIALEEQTQIFNRFYRGQMAESGDIPGTGLGLSFADHVARLHGGSLSVESELGEGSTFTMQIPKQ